MNFSIIKYVITDVDGVLTDGGIYTGPNGLIFKKFNVKDGAAIKILNSFGIKTIIMSSETDATNTKILQSRAKKIGIDDCFSGIEDKYVFLMDYMKAEKINRKNLVYIGDDINDLHAMKIAKFRACPKDAIGDIKNIANIKLKLNGGQGCFRELSEIIVKKL